MTSANSAPPTSRPNLVRQNRPGSWTLVLQFSPSSQAHSIIRHQHERLPSYESSLRTQSPVPSHIVRAADQEIPRIGHLLVQRVVHDRRIEPALDALDEGVDQGLLSRREILIP